VNAAIIAAAEAAPQGLKGRFLAHLTARLNRLLKKSTQGLVPPADTNKRGRVGTAEAQAASGPANGTCEDMP